MGDLCGAKTHGAERILVECVAMAVRTGGGWWVLCGGKLVGEVMDDGFIFNEWITSWQINSLVINELSEHILGEDYLRYFRYSMEHCRRRERQFSTCGGCQKHLGSLIKWKCPPFQRLMILSQVSWSGTESIRGIQVKSDPGAPVRAIVL